MFEVIQAIEYVEKPNDLGASQWVLIKGSDNNVYQVKFNQSSLYSNINEFIGNYIGLSIGVPVPKGIFLSIPENILEKCTTSLGFQIDQTTVKENIFFGVQWIYGKINFTDIDFLLEEIINTKNFKEYPSIFPYDQLLRNQDRHVDNHLIVQEDNNQKFYYSIDSDRIFAGYPDEHILKEKENFECFENPTYRILYDIVDEAFFDIILKYSEVIENFTEKQINLIDEYLESYYDVKVSFRENIREFISYRKIDFRDKCLKNQKCYKKVKQETLL